MVDAVALLSKKSRGSGGSGSKWRVIDTHHRQVPQFAGGSSGQFKDWAFAFKRYVRAADVKAFEMFTKAEVAYEVDWDELEDDVKDMDVKRYYAEICDLLCQAVTAEPLQTTIRMVEDMEGLEACRNLVARYIPKSLARAVRLMGKLTMPPKAP